jgi:hypothetical protein
MPFLFLPSAFLFHSQYSVLTFPEDLKIHSFRSQFYSLSRSSIPSTNQHIYRYPQEFPQTSLEFSVSEVFYALAFKAKVKNRENYLIGYANP